MNKLGELLIQLRSLADTQKTKVEVGCLRDEVSQKTQYRAIATSAASILAWFADNQVISFEERKNIDLLLQALHDVPKQNITQRNKSLNDVLKIAPHYNNRKV